MTSTHRVRPRADQITDPWGQGAPDGGTPTPPRRRRGVIAAVAATAVAVTGVAVALLSGSGDAAPKSDGKGDPTPVANGKQTPGPEGVTGVRANPKKTVEAFVTRSMFEVNSTDGYELTSPLFRRYNSRQQWDDTTNTLRGNYGGDTISDLTLARPPEHFEANEPGNPNVPAVNFYYRIHDASGKLVEFVVTADQHNGEWGILEFLKPKPVSDEAASN